MEDEQSTGKNRLGWQKPFLHLCVIFLQHPILCLKFVHQLVNFGDIEFPFAEVGILFWGQNLRPTKITHRYGDSAWRKKAEVFLA